MPLSGRKFQKFCDLQENLDMSHQPADISRKLQSSGLGSFPAGNIREYNNNLLKVQLTWVL